jgi:hypothetical protein
MSTTEFTTEDQLVTDLVAYWSATPPAGLPDGIPVVHFRRQGTLPLPAVIIGHEGFQRETAKGMTGTGRVNLRVAFRSDLDVMPSDDHRAIAAALDRALQDMTTAPGPLDLTHLHALLRESPDTAIQDRREITVLRYQAVATRMEPA